MVITIENKDLVVVQADCTRYKVDGCDLKRALFEELSSNLYSKLNILLKCRIFN